MNHINSPDTGDSAIEREIQAKGLTAPRVAPADIEANIIGEHYIPVGSALAAMGHMASYETSVSLNLLTICVLELRNGFTVTGESACASPENFNPEIGRKIARENAVQKVWPLLGYQLKEELFQRTRRTPE